MMRLLKAVFDALIPPHQDAATAASLTEDDLRTRVAVCETRGAIAMFPYRDPKIRSAVRAIKFYGETGVLAPLGAVAAEHLDSILEDTALDGGRKTLLVPIPSSPTRLRRRGYNQADRIARAIYTRLAHHEAIEYAPQALARL